jgi:hypothetical protein
MIVAIIRWLLRYRARPLCIWVIFKNDRPLGAYVDYEEAQHVLQSLQLTSDGSISQGLYRLQDVDLIPFAILPRPPR